jgi:hypothetical protein
MSEERSQSSSLFVAGIFLDHGLEDVVVLARVHDEAAAEERAPSAMADGVEGCGLGVGWEPGAEFLRDLLVEGDGEDRRRR